MTKAKTLAKRETRGGDVVGLLEHQHQAIRRGFRKAALPGPGRRRAFESLVRLLAVHEAAEEAHVHPKARHKVPGGKAVVKSRLLEEKQAKKMLVALEKLGPDNPSFRRKLRELRRAVLAHAAREEREEFAALRQTVSRPRRRALALESRLTQAVAPTRPHPWVNSQLANKLATPIAGPLDRGRDALRGLLRRGSPRR